MPFVISLWGADEVVGASPRAIKRYCPSTRPSSDTFVNTVPQSVTRIELAVAGDWLLAGLCSSPRYVSVYISSILFLSAAIKRDLTDQKPSNFSHPHIQTCLDNR